MDGKAPLGVLLLHGYTSSLDTVNGLVPTLERLGLPYRMPVLRGHGTHPRDLRGVTWRDWSADAEGSLDDLLGETSRAAVVGLSMGGLVTIDLGTRRADQVAGVALASPALAFSNPLARVSRPLSYVIRYAPMENSVRDPELAKRCTNYTKLETGSFASLYEYSKMMAQSAPHLKVPLLVVHSEMDGTIPPAAVRSFVARVGTPPARVTVRWLKRSGHEIMMDSEREEVFETIGAWLQSLRTTVEGEAGTGSAVRAKS